MGVGEAGVGGAFGSQTPHVHNELIRGLVSQLLQVQVGFCRV
jgi:hypothetical protein